MASVPTLILSNVHANPQEVKCCYKTCKEDQDDALQQLLSSKKLEIFGTW
jgi:hypothetical protein